MISFQCVCVFEEGLVVCEGAIVFMCLRTCRSDSVVEKKRNMCFFSSVFHLCRMRFMRVFER